MTSWRRRVSRRVSPNTASVADFSFVMWVLSIAMSAGAGLDLLRLSLPRPAKGDPSCIFTTERVVEGFRVRETGWTGADEPQLRTYLQGLKKEHPACEFPVAGAGASFDGLLGAIAEINGSGEVAYVPAPLGGAK